MIGIFNTIKILRFALDDRKVTFSVGSVNGPISIGLAAIVYGVLLYVFRVEEVRDVVNKVIGR